MAKTLEESDFTSAQKRIASLQPSANDLLPVQGAPSSHKSEHALHCDLPASQPLPDGI
jgi:hypothetical protein